MITTTAADEAAVFFWMGKAKSVLRTEEEQETAENAGKRQKLQLE
jgi:hypothetical protein